ncbi:MAG: Tricarboxylate transport protein TctC [Betaproteobacteria bacterium]|nr:Tricarboxylate transport protein TctC [Betaproteobacteria bacterium]
MVVDRRWRIVLALVCLFTAASSHAAESAYPTRPIRVIVPYPPGGSTDPTARAYGGWLSEKFGVPVVIDNRPGAGASARDRHRAPDARAVDAGGTSHSRSAAGFQQYELVWIARACRHSGCGRKQDQCRDATRGCEPRAHEAARIHRPGARQQHAERNG